ncbi:MAG: cytochrome c [Betaproteobacteria bacterium]|nr:MAG: cytochrome c [Betaproteobacteria bacterium]TAG49475.1 MAG: cytochrome c [Betaproteobacteria bacterium]
MNARAILTAALCGFTAQMAIAADIAAGAAKAKEVCAACHGMDGKSVDPNNPHLGGQWRDYLEKALRDYKSGERSNAIMGAFAKGLSQKDIANLAAYYAAQKPVLTQRP